MTEPYTQYSDQYCLYGCPCCNELRKVRAKKLKEEAKIEEQKRLKERSRDEDFNQAILNLHNRPLPLQRFVDQQNIPVVPKQIIDIVNPFPSTLKVQMVTMPNLQYLKPLQSTKQPTNMKPPIIVIDQPEIIDSNDRFFYVALPSEYEDGSVNYVIDKLITNFLKMFPNSYPAKAWCFTIANNAKNQPALPILYGLIRYDDSGYHGSAKSSHINNHIVSEYTKKKALRQYDMHSLTEYKGSRYITLKKEVMRYYEFIREFGPVIGSSMDKMIV